MHTMWDRNELSTCTLCVHHMHKGRSQMLPSSRPAAHACLLTEVCSRIPSHHATHVDNSCNATSTLYALQLTAARACCAQVHNTIRIRIVHTKTYASKTHGTKWDSATTTCTHAVAKKPAQHPHRTETIQVARRYLLNSIPSSPLVSHTDWPGDAAGQQQHRTCPPLYENSRSGNALHHRFTTMPL